MPRYHENRMDVTNDTLGKTLMLLTQVHSLIVITFLLFRTRGGSVLLRRTCVT